MQGVPGVLAGAGVPIFVSTASAKSAEVPASASTAGSAASAKSAEVPASASTGGCAVNAMSVQMFILVARWPSSPMSTAGVKAQLLISKHANT